MIEGSPPPGGGFHRKNFAVYLHESANPRRLFLMSQTLIETGITEEQHSEQDAQPTSPEPALTLSADDFSALEERVVRAVELVKRERQGRAAAEERAARAESLLSEQDPIVGQMKQEIRSLRTERDQVRQRVERLLSQLDALEL
jgi:hypothetical protein